MASFAGYDMPIQYRDGVMKEHLHTRERAGLFDVSHMGQAVLQLDAGIGTDDAHIAIANAIETLVPGEIRKLKKGGIRYTVLLNDQGGVLDDFMITRPLEDELQGQLFLVVNAATKEDDFALIEKTLSGTATLTRLSERALIALQGPMAGRVIESVLPGAGEQTFMTMRKRAWEGEDVFASRCGYTGEDGFEISIDAAHALAFAKTLLADDDVAPIGLGARDSLRLEAGLCLYGQDLTPQITPVAGNIAFAIGKRRRTEGGFPGAGRIIEELANGPTQLRVGIKPAGRAPARTGTEIQSMNGEAIGVVTSGGFGPSVEGPVSMGYVDAQFAKTGTELNLLVRGKVQSAIVVDMPFTPNRYYRGK